MKTEYITAIEELEDIISSCNVCHIGMVDEDGEPYVLPFTFGYKNGVLYLHSGNEGRKVKIFNQSPKVCVAFTEEKELYHQSPELACSYGMMFRSVLLYGKIEPVTDFDQKIEALHHIMHKYTTNRDYSFGRPSVENVACFRVKAEKITGRKRIK